MSKQNVLAHIKKRRLELNISQNELAEQLNISPRTYQRFENAESSTELDMIIEVLLKLGDDPGKVFEQSFKSNRALEYISDPFNLSFSKSESAKVHPNHNSPLNKIEISKALFESSNKNNELIGYWEWNLAENTYFWSEEMYQVYDVSRERESASDNILAEIIEPTELEEIGMKIKNLIINNITYQSTHTFNSGTVKGRVESIAKKYTTKNNQTIIFGIARRIRD